MTAITGLPDHPEQWIRRIETERSGPFVFEIGLVVSADICHAMQRVEDAHERFIASPLSQVASQLDREVVVSSVFGTNTIEGGTLTEDETAEALMLDPALVQQIEQRRAVNIKAAYDLSRQVASRKDWSLNLPFILQLHTLICQNLPHPDNRPGLIRDNPKHRVTHVGDANHGGRYKPPQYGRDIQKLLAALIDWQRDLQQAGIPALIRAPLAHLYYEQIHPFWDGNGRVGRVIEATILQAAGYRYAPFALARYYLSQIDAYFTLFNTCRKRSEKHAPAANLPFVEFHLEGMRQTFNALHNRVDHLVAILLYEARILKALNDKNINARQHVIVTQLLERRCPLGLDDLRRAPWYASLYLKLNDKTRQRDIKGLRDLQLVYLDTDNRLWPGFLEPGVDAR